MNYPLALALVKGIREPHEVKKKSFDLGGNRTHDLRIRSTITLPTELRLLDDVKNMLNCYIAAVFPAIARPFIG